MDGDSCQRLAVLAVERIKCHCRAVVEQDHEPVADMDQRDVLAGDAGEIQLHPSVEMDRQRLVALRLVQPDQSGRVALGTSIDRGPVLGDDDVSVQIVLLRPTRYLWLRYY